jgi:hypothetical protein
MSKKQKHRKHSRRRAFERHGIILSTSDLQGMAKRARAVMQNGGPSIRDTDSRSKVLIEWNGKRLWVVYSRSMQAIVTVLPENAFEQQEIEVRNSVQEIEA